MPRPEWRDPAKERYWRRLLGQWRRSGKTGRDFCAEHQLAEPSFYAWKREIARRDQERTARTQSRTRVSAPRRAATASLPAFVPVTVDAASADAALEVVLAGGRLLRVRAGFDADSLRQLLAVLEGPPC
jgi:hypothetical protein